MKHRPIPKISSLFVLIYGCRISERPQELLNNTYSGSRLNIGTPVKGRLSTVGASSSVFIPAKPVALSGFGGIGRRFVPPLFLTGADSAFCRPYERIENPPLIRAAVFEIKRDDAITGKLFLISLDIVAVTSDLTRKIHELIKSVVPDSEPSATNTIVVATHTHSGPAGLSEHPLWSAFVCDQFNRDLTNAYLNTLSETLKSAISSAENIQSIEVQSVNQPELFKSRFQGMQPATDITLTSFKTPSGGVPLSLLQLAAHPVYFGPRDLVLSSDLVSPVESAVRNSAGAQNVFLLQTTVGNMNALYSGDSPASWAANVSVALKQGGLPLSTTNLEISASAGEVHLSEPVVNWQACDLNLTQNLVSLPVLKSLPRTAPYSLWSFAQNKHLFLSGEWTTAAEAKIKDHLKDAPLNASGLKIFSLAHDYTAYHVTKNDYGKKELESCSSLFGDSAVDLVGEHLRSAEFSTPR
jgi:hypothetical protein